MSNSHLHFGHRARMRARYEKSPESFVDHEILELLLFYVIPQKDTNALAHELLYKFGSLSAVFEATPDQLKTVNGMGDTSALLFPLILDLFRRYMKEKKAFEPTSSSVLDAVVDRISSRYLGLTKELVTAVGLDAGLRIIGDCEVGHGNRSSSSIDMRLLAKFAYDYSPCHIVLVHNHPSGICLPSGADYVASDGIKDFLSQMQVHLLDHIILDGHGDFISFNESHFLDPENKQNRPLYSVTGASVKPADDGADELTVAEIMTKNQNKEDPS